MAVKVAINGYGSASAATSCARYMKHKRTHE